MTDEQESSSTERVWVTLLQRLLNEEYGALVRVVALAAFVYGTVTGRAEVMFAAIGAGVFPSFVGRPPK